MEEDQGFKFICKFCNKKYPCGKSLGGHMRSHVLANSAELEENLETKLKKVQSWSGGVNNFKKDDHHHQSKFELGGHSGYGLRENPKKTWRAVDSTSPLPQERVCVQCGKVFQSMKALCGHMACHSEKDKGGLKDDHSWTSESKKLVMDSHSDTEAEEDDIEPRLRTTRSKTQRYKRIVVKSSSFCLVNNNNNTSNNGSSSVSDIDGQEQEEVAKCLMMLSMDSGIWNGVDSVVESSDNNSVVLETKSSSIDMRIARKQSLKCVYNLDETPRNKKREDMNLELLDAEAQSVNSDSGYFLGENVKVETDVSVDGFRRNGNCQWSTSKTKLGVWCDESGTDQRKCLSRIKRYPTESRKDLIKENKYDDYGIASNSDKCESRKRTKDSSYHPELGNESFKKINLGFEGPEGSTVAHKKKKKYECLNCKKTFSSYQALGGHRPCHKKTNAYFESTNETGENSLDADSGPNYVSTGRHREASSNRKTAVPAQDMSYNRERKIKHKKFKGHQCPFCHRVFKSGQALGGHKRSHFIVGAEANLNQPSADKGEVADLLDLNLPAPVDDEDDGHAHFVSW